jgi:hypothetical protein
MSGRVFSARSVVGSTPEFTKRPRRRLFDAFAFSKEFANALSGKVRDAFED